MCKIPVLGAVSLLHCALGKYQPLLAATLAREQKSGMELLVHPTLSPSII